MTTRISELFDLSGKVAIITGASSGIGAHFAKLLAECDVSVVLAARRLDRIAEASRHLAKSSYFACDVTDDTQVDELVKFTCERYGKVDLLINNAGMADPKPALEEDPSHFRRVIETNLNSVFVASQSVAREMSKVGSGSIVNIASVLGLVASGVIPQASYAASKAGVVNLTRELAAQWVMLGIRVNAIAPGWFPSEMTSVMFEEGKGLNWITRNTPMRRGGDLDELSGALLLLASGAGSFITGQTIVVDGGWTLT